MSGVMVARTARPVAPGGSMGAWILVGIVAGLLPLVAATVAQAQGARKLDAQVTPSYDAAGNLLRQGYDFAIQDDWPRDSGYRYVRFELQANPPLREDATVTIRHESYGYSAQPILEVEQDFELPAGQTGMTQFAMSVPNHRFVIRARVQVWIDGVPQPGLDSIYMYKLSGARSNDVQVLDIVPPPLSGGTVSLSGSQDFERTFIKPDQLSSNWIDYTAFDVVCIRRQVLQELMQKQPQVGQAIRHWVAAGGNLWIDEMGDNRQTWPEVAQLLGLPVDGLVDEVPSANATWLALVACKQMEWYGAVSPYEALLLPELSGARSRTISGGQILGQIITFEDPDGNVTLELAAPDLAPDDAMFDLVYMEPSNQPASMKGPQKDLEQRLFRQVHGIRQCASELGHVVLMADSWIDAMAVFDRVGAIPDFAQHVRMHSRGNGSLARQSIGPYANWLIPGVGRPPVVLFQVLISLFVVVIGPLNYFMLRRKGRLHLLVVTVPLSAALVTGGLIGYAALAEGFETHVRVRSVTYLDQTRGQAACWSRQTYYAGVAPGDGLQFPADVAVYPILADWQDSDQQPLELVWAPQQHLTRGWIQSRTLAQFLCVRSRATTAALEVESQPGSPPRVTNRLGTKVIALLLSDSDGKIYAATNLAENSQAELQTSQLGDAAGAIRDVIFNNPIGDHATSYRVAIPAIDDDYLEWLIRQVETAMAVPNPKLAPCTYVALVELSPEVAIGCDAGQVRSLHIIRGRW